MKELEKLRGLFTNATARDIVQHLLSTYGDRVALASSLGAEDQVLTHLMAGLHPSPRIFTLDTGRLFPETYDLIERTRSRYRLRIEIFAPQAHEVEQMVNAKGVNLFYHSVENRKECCGVRKINPLRRAFQGLDVWICGLRREQSVTRADVQVVEWDQANGLIKVNPLIGWSESDVWAYIKQHEVPYNPMHDKGFPSIGCQPCTRAIAPGEDVRAGRWWWENPESKECGLHKAR